MRRRSTHPTFAWPPRSEPGEVPVFARNEILVLAEPDVIWSYIVGATRWPDWYPGSADVRIVGENVRLAFGVRFHWRTFDLPVTSQVKLWQPYAAIAWDARAPLTFAFHRWAIEPAANGFTRVVTEETQRGVLPWLLRWYLRGRLHRQHATWLQNLKCLAEGFGDETNLERAAERGPC